AFAWARSGLQCFPDSVPTPQEKPMPQPFCTARTLGLRARSRAWLVGLVLGLPGAAQAVGTEALEQTAREWLQPALAASQPADEGGAPLRTEVEVGSLDRRLRLAPCDEVEAFMPRGARLWGRSRIGLRCVEG